MMFDDVPEKPASFPGAKKAAVGTVYEVEGKLARFRFRGDDGLFAIAMMDTKRHRNIVIRGGLPGIEVGDDLRIKGKWVESKYGPQIEVQDVEHLLPITEEGVAKFLSTQLPGVGPKLARRIVDTFGVQAVDVLDNEPHRLNSVEGIGGKKLEKIKEQWQQRHGQRTALLFLTSHGVTLGLASRILRQYEAETLSIVRSEPYRMAREVHGIGFATADRIALKLGFAHDAPERIEAGVLHILQEREAADGHCFVPRIDLQRLAADILQVDGASTDAALDRLIKTRDLIEEPAPEGEVIFSRRTWSAEVSIATQLDQLMENATGFGGQKVLGENGTEYEVEPLVRKVASDLALQLAPEQELAVRNALTGQLVVVTGGPGTGKTTLVKVLVEACTRVGIPVHLGAPTGRAAKRMAEATQREAKTLHRLLEFSFQSGGFTRNEDEPLDDGLYVVDETSMIDVFLMRALLSALPSTARLVLVGDVDQLPSVGPGTILRDLIESSVVPYVRLTQVFRQAQESYIIRNAHRINQGQLPQLPDVEPDKLVDYFAVNVKGAEAAENLIVDLVAHRIPKTYAVDPLRDIQVLCPMRVRQAGAEAINLRLQQELNPNGLAVTKRENSLKVGDKVMQLKNNYDKDVYNGDVGRIVAFSKLNKIVKIDYDDRIVEYQPNELDELMLAYACTVHKSQGSEYPVVVIPVLRAHYHMLQRNLIYTALTRARRLAIFVCEPAALRQAVMNAQPAARNTRLDDRLNELAMSHA